MIGTSHFLEILQKRGMMVSEDIHVVVKELRVRQLELELQNEKLLKKRLDDLEAFSFSVIHDLRAPLRAISGFSSLLEDKFHNVLGSEGLRLLKVITTSATKMDHLILGLQALNNVNRIELSKKMINNDDMVRSCIAEVVSSEDLNRVTFKIENLMTILGDPKLIRKVWTNLIENAVKFSVKKEKPIVQITSQLENNFIVFRVSDNGVGFNPEYQYKLFTLFQRLHDTDEFSGTGVGLAIVDSIIQKHGGKVWAEGVEEVGATFYFSMPIV